MIDGLKIDVTSLELADQLNRRAEFHAEKIKWCARQVEALEGGGLEHHAVTNDPIHSLENNKRNHENRYAYFRFMAEHVIPGETYRLSESDLTRLEILSRYL